ncbi:MAG: M10 family metallopeptidase C-terminal domain-containing protein, partial [Planctomycetaceae bacterium]
GLTINGAAVELSSVESAAIVGGTGNDRYQFDADASLGTVTLEEVGAGRDTIDLSLTTTLGVDVNLNTASAQVVNANLSLTLTSATTFEDVIGGSGNDTLTGNASINSITGGGGDDIMIGGAHHDTYVFGTATSAESDSIVESPGIGTDILDFSALTTAVTVDLSSILTQTVHTNRSLTLNSASSVENIYGGSGDDSLGGNTLANAFFGGRGSDTLIGDAGDDSYIFGTAASAEADIIIESTGIDTLNFSALSTAVTLDLGTTTAQPVHSNRTLTLLTPTSMENVLGGSGNDRLTGNSLNNSLSGQAGFDILKGGLGHDVLIGGLGHDSYVFEAAASAEFDSVSEFSGGGIDTLDFFALTTDVNVDLGSSVNQTVDANRTLSLNSATTFENIYGGSGNDILRGNAVGNAFVGGRGSDAMGGEAGDDIYIFGAAASAEADIVTEQVDNGIDTLNFSALTTAIVVDLGTTTAQAVHLNRTLTLSSTASMENVIGGSGNDSLTGNTLSNVITGGAGSDGMAGGGGNDTYVLRAATSAEFDSFVELAGGGTDTLDFSALTIALNVDLGSTSNQTIHTNRSVNFNSDTSIENVIGGFGNDQLTGNASSNVLVGNGGDDQLFGLLDRDILVGGFGVDTLQGGGNDDILIAGRTTSDRNVANLISLQTAWISAATYAERVATLRAGTGTPVASLKAEINVLDDAGADDTLTGNAGEDWYFRAIDDVITDLVSGEDVDML